MQYSLRIDPERIVLGEGAAFLKLALPYIDEKGSGAFYKRFTAYVEGIKKGFLHYAQKVLLPAAASRKGGPPYGGGINTELCHRGKGLVSLYMDATVTDGNGRRTYRLPLLWDTDRGVLINPKRLFVKGASKKLTALIAAAIEAKAAALALPLYSDWAAIARRRFDIERFYISPLGGVFFYQGRTLSERPEPLALPLSAELLGPLLALGAEDRMWGGTTEE